MKTSPKSEKEKAWLFYSSWKKKSSFSPAFNKKIVISGKGWKHLFKKNGRKRSWSDVSRRLKLLPYAKEIIEKSTTLQSFRYQNRLKYFTIEALVEVGLSDHKNIRKICAVLIEKGDGEIIFYSVMDKRPSR